jgi:hypothetical protein
MIESPFQEQFKHLVPRDETDRNLLDLLYRFGSAAEASRQSGLSIYSFRPLFRRYSIRPKRGAPRWEDHEPKEIAMWEQGMSLSEISAEMGTSRQNVQQKLARWAKGYGLRPESEKRSRGVRRSIQLREGEDREKFEALKAELSGFDSVLAYAAAKDIAPTTVYSRLKAGEKRWPSQEGAQTSESAC